MRKRVVRVLVGFANDARSCSRIRKRSLRLLMHRLRQSRGRELLRPIDDSLQVYAVAVVTVVADKLVAVVADKLVAVAAAAGGRTLRAVSWMPYRACRH